MPRSFTKRIVRPGSYKLANGSVVDIDADRIEKWNAKHAELRKQGFNIPIPLDHSEDAVPTKKPLTRRVDKSWIDPTGWLTMELVADTDEDANLIREVKDVSLATFETMEGLDMADFIGHVALTGDPVVKDQGDVMPNAPAIAMSLSMSMSVEDPPQPTIHTAGSVLQKLAKLGIELPPDTNESNILERLGIGLSVLLSQQKKMEGDVDTPPNGAKTQKPSPIAMSAELRFALSKLKEAKVFDAEGNPFTEETIATAVASQAPTLEMSASDKAAVREANERFALDYKSRIEACVSNGQITPDVAQKRGQELLDNQRVVFSNAGERQMQQIDYVLEAWEAIPHGAVIAGQSPTGYKKAIAGDQFSLGTPPKMTIEVRPDDHADTAGPVDDDRAAAAADAMLQA